MVKQKKKQKKSITVGIANIKTTFNNTIITICDILGNTLCWDSSGTSGFKGARKNTPFAAQMAARNVAGKALELGMEKIEVVVKGRGNGRESSIRALKAAGLNIISIEDNYNDDFVEENNLIINSLKEGGTSLCLFHGDPGCGKTHYIRYLIAELCKEKKKVIYFPNEHIHFLSDPSFLHFFKDHKKSIIIIEDAEEILTSRELSLSNRGISNLLNLTDGLMGDFLELKFVCTFNTAIDKIDKALLRKGRITTNYKFEKLNVLILSTYSIIRWQFNIKYYLNPI
jgi:ribosomal protein uS11